MRILVTNDDGIQSEGLAIVVKWATKLGEVWVSAPQCQQSGKSHAISIHQGFPIGKVSLGLGEHVAYAVGSTPVDCVRFANLGLSAEVAQDAPQCPFHRVHNFSVRATVARQNLSVFC